MKIVLPALALSLVTVLLSAPAVASAAPVGADEVYVTEWRLAGPAFSRHFTSDGQISKSRDWGICRRGDGLTQKLAPYYPKPGAGVEDWSIPAEFQTPDSQCSSNGYLEAERIGWRSNNPALGLRYTRRHESHADHLQANLVRDSYSTVSVMLGAGRTWPLHRGESVHVEAGVIGGLWYRSVLNRSEDGLVRRVVPFALPTLTATHAGTGLGLDISLAPKLSIAGKAANRTPAVLIQVTYLISSQRSGASQLGLTTTDGGLQGSITTTF